MYFLPVLRFRLFIFEKLKANVTHEWMYGVVVFTKLISRIAYLSTSTTLMTGMVWIHIIPATLAEDFCLHLTD